MAKIQRLSPALVNKIAAGEVIERPASVVKELVENSVDAGAKRLEVTIAKGGTELIRISDDGCGIAPDEMLLAVASHATSKLDSADDLFRVGTFGFRGEALASISQVSHFRIRSRMADREEGTELMVIGGEPGELVPCGGRPGTEIEVKNLFFNTPVRRRFLKSTQTEMGHVTEAVTRIALAHWGVHFTLNHGNRTPLDLPATELWIQRIERIFGRQLSEALIEVRADEGDVKLHGFVANPSHDRSNSRMQYLFLNGRFIRDRALSHALTEAYRGLLMTGRYAISFINIEIPPDQVDVNVHPTKMEVRFADGGRIYSQLLGTIRSKFLATNLTSGATKPAIQSEPAHPVRSPHANAEQRRMAFDFSGTGKARQDATGAAIAHTSGGPTSELPAFRPFPRGPGYPSPVPRANHAAPQTKAGGTVGVAFSDEGAPAMQVYNRYLITETDEGVVVIDQHALHERILYEELRRKILSSNLESQKLLVPEPVQLTSAECSAILEQREVLTKLGIEVESIASSTLLVLAYPALLANLGPAEILRQAADKITDTTDEIDPRDLCDELLHMISCKAAIKAGDPLTRSEVAELLRQRHLCQDAHHCPHGRPTTLVFSRTELDRRFKRT